MTEGKSRRRLRANGEGWINERPDGKGFDVGLHLHLPDGTTKRKSTTRKKRADAAKWLNKQKSMRDDGVILSNENPPLAIYLQAWLEDSVRVEVKAVTYKHYRRMVKNHISPVLGGVKVKAVTPRHIQRLHAIKRDEGLSLATRLHVHTTIRKALAQAHAWGDIPTNPAALVKPPKGHVEGSKERDQDIQPFTEEELAAFLEASRAHRLHALYVFAPASGLREQELCALRWSDLELPDTGVPRRGIVRVRNAVVETEKGFAIDELKTKASKRSVEFPPNVVAILRRHRHLQQEEQLAADPGREWDKSLVFPTAHGTLLNRFRLGHHFRNMRKKSGVDPRHQFRDFRHTFATLLFARGMHPKKVQEAMGHSSIKQTLDTYSHYVPTMSGDISDALGDVF